MGELVKFIRINCAVKRKGPARELVKREGTNVQRCGKKEGEQPLVSSRLRGKGSAPGRGPLPWRLTKKECHS